MFPELDASRAVPLQDWGASFRFFVLTLDDDETSSRARAAIVFAQRDDRVGLAIGVEISGNTEITNEGDRRPRSTARRARRPFPLSVGKRDLVFEELQSMVGRI